MPLHFRTPLNLHIVTTKMVKWRTKFIYRISLLQFLKHPCRVFGYHQDIISVSPYVVVATIAPPNPDIRVKSGWFKLHVPQGLQQVCMPPIPAGRQPIQRLLRY